ncbi:hypothetical protein [Enterococcus alishanensis]
MNFKAIDIRKLTFKTTVGGGFRKKDVEDFLSKAASDYEVYDERLRKSALEKDDLAKEYEEQFQWQTERITRLEAINSDVTEANQELNEENQTLQKQLLELKEVQELNLSFGEVKKLRKIAENSLSAAENAANRLIDEAENQKMEMKEEAEDEKNQYLLNAQLEINELVKQQEAKEQQLRDRELALEQRQEILNRAKADFRTEVLEMTEMMYGVQKELTEEYSQEIQLLQEKKKHFSKTSVSNKVTFLTTKETG